MMKNLLVGEVAAAAAIAFAPLAHAQPAHAYTPGQCVGLDFHDELNCVDNACRGNSDYSACYAAVLLPAYKPYPPDQQDYPRN
jgi:hypothetical protein